MREYITSLLERKWDVRAVCDGLEALRDLKAHPTQYDLVLSDIVVRNVGVFKMKLVNDV